MKKRTKSNFIQMATLLAELDVEKQRRILGGTAVAITPPDDVDMIPVVTVAPCLTVESISMTTTMAPVPTLTSSVETSSMPESTVSMPLETTSTPEMVTSPMPVLSCVTIECIPTTTTMAPDPTLTSPVETSSMPESTVSTPLETTSTPETVTSPMFTTTLPELTCGVEAQVSTGECSSNFMITKSISVDSLSENRQFSDIIWDNMGDLSSGIGIINDLSESMFEGLGQVGTVLGVIDMAHQAIMLYDNGELSSRNVALYGVDILLMSGEIWGFGVGMAWSVLDYETEELRKQGKNFLIDMENGMGKNGDYSSIKYYWGY